ncbi:XrtA/PEP-CTERM system TPR-repeat protein PrsT [Halochromatium roseum]|uniref:XrtA/PEP-CTERM system TPR-repeat protein PrsT n=1 Tax=Halochromatium roseum TaxID=391920 RepID=UPI0019116E05|nr:XrtA/PEP-CTERM system TPR-repeat protein PrsT [Halochromatium roseum]
MTGGLTGCGGSASSDDYLARGQAALQEGDLPTAAIELKNALQANPEQAVARALLGQTLARQGNAVAAIQELERAQGLGAEFGLLQPWLAEAWLQAGEFAKVAEVDVNQATPGAQQAQLLALKAAAALASGDTEDAAAKAQNALEADATLPAATLTMAQVQFAQGNTDQARAFVDRTLTAEPTNGNANLLLGEIERRVGDLEAAEAAFSAAMKDPLTASRAQLNRAYTRIQQNNLAGAREDIGDLQETLKDNALVAYAEGLLLYTENRYREAIERIDIALGSNPNLQPALRLAGATRLALEEPKLAKIHLQRFLSVQPDDIGAQRLLAMAQLQTGEAEAAEAIARELVARDPEDAAAMNLLASTLMMQGKREEGTAYLRRVKAVTPSSPELDMRLGMALLEQGDEEEGLRLLRETAAQNPESATAVEKLVAGLARSGDLDEALKTAKAYQQQHPNAANAHVLVAAVYLQQGETEQAKAAFEQAIDKEPGHLPASRALASLAAQAEDYALASDILKSSLSQHPDDLELLIALTKLASAQDDAKTAKAYLDQALERHPDSITPRLYMTAYYLQQGNAEEALSWATDAVALEPENIAAIGLRADAQLALGDNQAARASLQELVGLLEQPNPRVLYALARTNIALGNPEDAKAALEQAHAADPDFTPVLLALGRLAILQQNIDEAAGYLTTLQEQLGANQRDVLLMQSDLARLQGNLAVADDAFRSLLGVDSELNLDQDNELWSAAEQLVLAYIQQGDPEAGIEAAEELASRQPDSARTQALLGLLYLRDQDLDKAATAFEQALKLDPANATATNGLVSIAVQKDDFEAANNRYKAALQQNPSDLSLLLGAARLALLQKDPEAAETFLLSGVERNPQSAAATFYLGAFYLRQGHPEKTLELVTTASPDLRQEPRLLALKAESELNLERFRTALRTLETLNRLQPNQQRVLLTLANTQARLGQLSSARETLRQILDSEPESVPALRGLVRLALAENSPRVANQNIDALREILGSDHNDVLQFEGQVAEQAEDLELALSKYRRVFEQSPTSASLLPVARVLTRQEQIAAARDLLEGWVEEYPDDHRTRLALAQLELTRGTSERAIKEYQTLIDKGVASPEVLNNLAWLLKERDPDQALIYARQAYSIAPDSAEIADTLAVVLLGRNELLEARRMIDSALQIRPDNPSMRYHKALIMQGQGELTEARALVEQVLADPTPFPEREEAERWLQQ